MKTAMDTIPIDPPAPEVQPGVGRLLRYNIVKPSFKRQLAAIVRQGAVEENGAVNLSVLTDDGWVNADNISMGTGNATWSWPPRP